MLEFVGGMAVMALLTGNVFSLGAAVRVAAFAVVSQGKIVYKLISKSKNKNKREG